MNIPAVDPTSEPAGDPQGSLALRPTDPAHRAVWDIASHVPDPEVPVLTIEDLGILRGASAEGDTARVVITPTYSGCPAMGTISADVTAALKAAGYQDVQIDLVLQPAWTTDWMTESGKQKLEEYGIAPPTGHSAVSRVGVGLSVKCPRCHSRNTKEMTRFGSTACKALYQCLDCLEPFDYFKVH
ncbi:1,2-phenylacetyl-CoA epoxidase subunit PaaD [Neomicrococcus lactis]|uniref:1,2-phenylacetyl-CoA epoxidase subunit PaaD n=1 Tax=Neomicrococcus lactis TaxID=732241 RepID=UPI002301E27B|nr:1,2-phenylacetyl-CoA epoxidase subunit PaaD [Neomicrococcus lactis]